MKKHIFLFLTIATCITFMTGCSFFSKISDKPLDDTQISSDTDIETTQQQPTEDEGEEIPVDNPEDNTADDTTEADSTTEADKDSSDHKEPSNPRDNVAADSSKEYSTSGKYCGFIDSISVEIEMADGSYCSFFVYKEDVKNTLSALDEEDMPEISFTYKAREGQVNPEMTSVIGG